MMVDQKIPSLAIGYWYKDTATSILKRAVESDKIDTYSKWYARFNIKEANRRDMLKVNKKRGY